MAWDLSGVDGSYPPGGSSCAPPDSSLSRWAALSAAVQVFVNTVDSTGTDELLGLVSYASAGEWCGTTKNDSDIEQTLTGIFDHIEDAMQDLGNNPIPGNTNISAGIDNGVIVLTDPSRSSPSRAC